MKSLFIIFFTFLLAEIICGQPINKIKFPNIHQFESYKTDVYEGNLAKPIVLKERIGRFSKKEIERIYYKDGVNFGGHYCFILLGCGNLCYNFILIDVKTGVVYNGVSACLLYNFKKESKMLIANVPELDLNGYYDEDCCYPCKKEVIGDVYVWNESKKNFMKLKTK